MSRIDANRDIYETWPVETKQAVLDGKVDVGMLPEMVKVAWGTPSEVVASPGGGPGDEIWVYNTEKDLEDLLLTLPLNVRILGVEYEGKEFTGREICHKRNIDLYFNGRDHSFSSSSLRKRVYEAQLQKEPQ